MSKKKTIILLVIILVVVLFVYQLTIILSRRDKIKVDLLVAPTKASVTVNGKEINGRTLYLKPGEYEFEAMFNNFEPSKITQDISINPEVLLSAEPKSEEAIKYLEQNPKEQEAFEAVGAKFQNIIDKKSEESYPFLKDLPIEQRYFSLYNGRAIRSVVKDGGYVAAIYVKADSAYGRSLAVNSIRNELNIDPTVIEVYFQDAPPVFWERGE